MTFALGLFLGSLIPAVAIFLTHGSRAACLAFGILVPLAFALKFPRKIGRALLWVAGERGEAPRASQVKGYEIIKTADGFRVPALDAESVFDTRRDAARFIRSAV